MTLSKRSNGLPRALQLLAMTGRGLKTFFSCEVPKNRRTEEKTQSILHSQLCA